jgi:hypothetical protein
MGSPFCIRYQELLPPSFILGVIMIMIGLFPCSNASCFPTGSPYQVSTVRPWSSSSPDLTFPSNLRTTVFLVWLGLPSFFHAFSWRHPLAVGCLETSYVVISYNLELVRSVFRSPSLGNVLFTPLKVMSPLGSSFFVRVMLMNLFLKLYRQIVSIVCTWSPSVCFGRLHWRECFGLFG